MKRHNSETHPAGERVEHFETIRRCKDGSQIDISLTISPIKDEKGEIVGASKIARDITGSKKAEEQLRRALEFDETVMLSMGEGLYTVDNQGRVTFMNPAAQQCLDGPGQRCSDAGCMTLPIICGPTARRFRPVNVPDLRCLHEGTMLSEFEDVFIRKMGASSTWSTVLRHFAATEKLRARGRVSRHIRS